MCAAVHRMTAFHVCCDPSQRQMDVPWSRSLLHCAWVWWNKCTVYVTPFFCPLPQDYRRWLTRLATYLSNSMRNKPGPSKLVLCSFTACNARAACHNHTHTRRQNIRHTRLWRSDTPQGWKRSQEIQYARGRGLGPGVGVCASARQRLSSMPASRQKNSCLCNHLV